MVAKCDCFMSSFRHPLAEGRPACRRDRRFVRFVEVHDTSAGALLAAAGGDGVFAAEKFHGVAEVHGQCLDFGADGAAEDDDKGLA